MPHTSFSTAFGRCSLAWNEAGLAGFRLPETSERESDAVSTSELPSWVTALITRVQGHLSGVLEDFSDATIDWSRVSEFQQRVYREALAIKPGRTKSYGELARALQLGPEGARAVGAALATNPWPLIVPCHRIVAADGRMTGFSAPGGVRTKTRLLVLEGAELISE